VLLDEIAKAGEPKLHDTSEAASKTAIAKK
jgi:hypothetical protein